MIHIMCKSVILNPVLSGPRCFYNNLINNNRNYIHTVGRVVKSLVQTDSHRLCKMPLFLKNKTRCYSSFNKTTFTCKKCSSHSSSVSRVLPKLLSPSQFSSKSSLSSCSKWNQFYYGKRDFYVFNFFYRNNKLYNNLFRSNARYFYSNAKLNRVSNRNREKSYSAKDNIRLEKKFGGEMKRLFQLAKREKWKLAGKVYL